MQLVRLSKHFDYLGSLIVLGRRDRWKQCTLHFSPIFDFSSDLVQGIALFYQAPSLPFLKSLHTKYERRSPPISHMYLGQHRGMDVGQTTLRHQI